MIEKDLGKKTPEMKGGELKFIESSESEIKSILLSASVSKKEEPKLLSSQLEVEVNMTPSVTKEELSYKEKYEIIQSSLPAIIENLKKASPSTEQECLHLEKLVNDPINYTPQFGSHLLEEKSLSLRIESEEGADSKSPAKEKPKEENQSPSQMR